jgi:hypothetical protein
MRYFYAPIFHYVERDEFTPGMTSNTGIIVADLPTPCSSPLCDKGDAQRFVMAIPQESFEAPEGWEEKNKEEVNEDYPGLLP